MHGISQCASEVFFALCKSVNSPVSLGLWLRFKYGAIDQLVSYELPIHDYTEADCVSARFEGDYLCASYLRKEEALHTTFDRKQAAIDAFHDAESSNLHTNNYLNSIYGSEEDPVAKVLNLAARKIDSLLGEFCIDELRELVSWGSNASSSIPRRVAGRARRAGENPVNLPPSAFTLFNEVIEDDYPWLRAMGIDAAGPTWLVPSSIDFEKGSTAVFDVVPKNAKTDRGIAKGATALLFLQKGIGKLIRRRVGKLVGDLTHQSHNRLQAEKAFVKGYATIDLSSASDLIAYNLVEWLLPDTWFQLLKRTRHEYIHVEGNTYLTQKFSSMGDGYTFELESLIFYAITWAVKTVHGLGGPISVYGDDIVVSGDLGKRLTEFLPSIGMRVNLAKSYTEGLFYESCGGHYFHGVDVTPIFLKEDIDSEVSAIKASNAFVRSALRSGRSQFLENPWRVIQRHWRLPYQIPLTSEEDIGYLVQRPSKYLQKRQDGKTQVQVLVEKTRKVECKPQAVALAIQLREPTQYVEYYVPAFRKNRAHGSLAKTRVINSVVSQSTTKVQRRKRWYQFGGSVRFPF